MNKNLRIGFTIILNGKEHLLHNNYAEYLLNECLDYWIVIEGASSNNGSTRWCKGSNNGFHHNGFSVDGTTQYLLGLKEKYKNLIYCPPLHGVYRSKDDMVNLAINEIKKITDSCWLWQIDIDEQWTKENMQFSENEIEFNNIKDVNEGLASFNHFVGKNLIAKGFLWGSNYIARLWRWKGEYFLTHEPPQLNQQHRISINLTKKFNHYSYYFDSDVKFKSLWYYNDLNIYNNWKKIQEEKIFPIPTARLLPIYKLNSEHQICKIENIKELKNIKYYNLLMPFFVHKQSNRNAEFIKCLKKNIENKYIKKIYLFFKNYKLQKDIIFNNKKIVIIPVYQRQTYKMLIDYANLYLRNEICILSNTDIWFDESIKKIENIDIKNKIIALTRYNFINNYKLHDESGCCHDTWIFESPLHNNFNINIEMGILGCDSLFNLRALKSGIELKNYCYDIKSYHEHSDLSHDSKTRNNRFKNLKSYQDEIDWYDFRLKPTELK